MTEQQTSTSDQAARRRAPGRPRQVDTEGRAYRAVLELFGQKGWSGISLDAVATKAGIGKSSIYLRWKDKRDLLTDALRDLEEHLLMPEETEELNLRDYIVAYATARAEFCLSEHGRELSYLYSAAKANPDAFAEIRQLKICLGVLSLRARIDRACAEGELPKDTPVGQVLDAIEGAVLVHMLFVPQKNSEELRAEVKDYVTTLVDILLRGGGSAVVRTVGQTSR